jgi:glucokinase
VEDVISGRGIRSRVAETASVQEIAERADRGDPQAMGVLAAVGSDLGEFLTPWCAEFRATVVVVGGSIARAWDHFGEALAQSLSIEAVVAERLDGAALLGAALHASRDGNPSG